MRPSKARAFLFTWNNYSEDWRAKLEHLDTTYCCAGKETAPTTGTPHIQGYLRFKSPRSFRKLQTDFVKAGINAHITIAKGTPQQNRTYCTKV